jgi:hypothetical protein
MMSQCVSHLSLKERGPEQVISKIVVTASAVFLVGTGLALNFLPQEVAAALGLGAAPMVVLILQVLAAALLGMGFLNWLSKGNPMGGIYSRPLALENLLLYGVAAISLDRAALHAATPRLIELAAVVFTAFAIAFGWLMFLHDPTRKSQNKPAKP